MFPPRQPSANNRRDINKKKMEEGKRGSNGPTVSCRAHPVFPGPASLCGRVVHQDGEAWKCCLTVFGFLTSSATRNNRRDQTRQKSYYSAWNVKVAGQ